ncbi:hypothetical protein M153_15440001234 [Pseudoloma neurophilia]|uniref:Uncharacterized protein n=1 Tax=Pseudoloma neurophilia TaxID=146866 RepID=A0A0R0LYX2_9MICR|nr:hypothetical protein M153_15440001234 [Pseudoloma neurophilia]
MLYHSIVRKKNQQESFIEIWFKKIYADSFLFSFSMSSSVFCCSLLLTSKFLFLLKTGCFLILYENPIPISTSLVKSLTVELTEKRWMLNQILCLFVLMPSGIDVSPVIVWWMSCCLVF